MRFFWLTLGLLALTLGMIGAFLPLLPTVPFVLLATFAFSKSSEKLHNWLVSHPRFGPAIHDWNSKGAIGPGAKKLATLSIAATLLISLILVNKPEIIGIQAAVLSAVMVFIWTRPSS